jgi:hypothetical protein
LRIPKYAPALTRRIAAHAATIAVLIPLRVTGAVGAMGTDDARTVFAGRDFESVGVAVSIERESCTGARGASKVVVGWLAMVPAEAVGAPGGCSISGLTVAWTGVGKGGATESGLAVAFEDAEGAGSGLICGLPGRANASLLSRSPQLVQNFCSFGMFDPH